MLKLMTLAVCPGLQTREVFMPFPILCFYSCINEKKAALNVFLLHCAGEAWSSYSCPWSFTKVLAEAQKAEGNG